MKIALIQKAQEYRKISNTLTENLITLATQQQTILVPFCESIIHVLFGLEQTAANMHPRSVATLLAGVEKLSTTLGSIEDSTQKKQSLKLLTSAAVTYDDLVKQSLPNHSVVGIARYGDQFPELVQKYLKVASGPNATQQIGVAAHQLIKPIKQVMHQAVEASTTIATKSNPVRNNAPRETAE